MSDATSDLPLFHGPHIPRIRFEQALDCLDLRAAVEAAPEPWQAAVETLAVVLEQAGTPARTDIEALARCRCDGWPASLQQTWERLMGLRLDGRGVPGTYGGELAATFLLRAGKIARARDSLSRHLDDGSQILPQIDDNIFDLDERQIDPETHFRSMMGEEAVQALQRLAETITARLTACGLRTLAASELEKPLRWLRAGEETLIGADPHSVITVRDALFFEQL